MAAVLGLDDDQVEVACRRADGDVWVANFNAPGQVVIAGSPEGVAAAGAQRQGARRQEGHAAAGVRRVPHAVHGAGPRPPAQGHRRGRPPRHRGAGRRPTSTPSPTTRAASGRACCRPSCRSPVRWKHCLLTLADARRHRLRRARPRRRAHRHGQAHRRRRPHHRRSPTPDDLDKLLECRCDAGRTAGAGQLRGRAPLRHRTPRRQPGGRRVHAASGDSPTGAHDRRRHVLGHVGEPRGPLAVRRRAAELHRRATASGSPPASPSPGCGRPEHARRPERRTWRRHHRLGHRPARQGRHQRRPRRHDGHHRRVDRRAHRHPRAPRRRHHRGPVDRVRAGRPSSVPASTRPTIDVLVLATTTPDQTVPATSATVQHELGLRCGAFDVNAACSGFVYAPGRGPRPHRHRRTKRASSSAPTRLSRITDWTDRNTAILFADGSGAVVLEAVDGPRPAARLGPRRRRLGRAPPLRRRRRLHPDGRQGGLPPRRADHGRLRPRSR